MNLITSPKSPYWLSNLHIGFTESGKKRYSQRSSKVVRDSTRINDRGQRQDKIEAMAVLLALQNVANQTMQLQTDVVSRKDFEAMVAGVIAACGKDLTPESPSWQVFADQVLKRHCKDLSPASVRSYQTKKSVFDKWLGSHSRLSVDSSMADFKLADIQEFYDDRIAAGTQSTTANGNITGIQLVFEEAVIHDLIAKNPCKGIKRRDNVMVPRQPFTLADLAAISSAIVEHAELIEHSAEWAIAIRFSMFTGAREGDCVSLRWTDFSNDCREVRFVPSKKARLHRLGKIDASVSLLLPEFVANELTAIRAGSTSEFLTPSLRAIKPGKRGLGARFREIMDFAGIKYTIRPGQGENGIAQLSHSFHSLRHTIKTELRAAGVSSGTSDYVTGHTDARVSARYVHERAETIFRECSPVFESIQAAIQA